MVALDFPLSGLRVAGPRLLVVRPPRPVIAVDARLLDRVDAAPATWLSRLIRRPGLLRLGLGRLRVSLDVADGTAAARRLAAALSPYARDAAIVDAEGWQDARRRLDAALAGRAAPAADEQGVSLADEVVRVEGDAVVAGGARFAVSAVRLAAVRGENLAVRDGVEIQAALLLLLVAAEERRAAGEDVDGLRARITAYEKMTGRGAGR